MDYLMIQELKEHLELNKEILHGDWVRNNSSYDGDICKLLNMEENTVRYWDAIWNGMYIEFKKGNSIWLDLVRYSEVLTKSNSDAEKETFTLFFIPNKERTGIVQVIGVRTQDIIDKLGLNEIYSKELLELNSIVPRSLNAQASLTKKDVTSISSFVI